MAEWAKKEMKMVRVYVVCSNPENGQYLAVNTENPTQCVVRHSRSDAIADFVERYMCECLSILDVPMEYAPNQPEASSNAL